MNKIIINYDLLDKIKESENGYKVSRYYKYGAFGNLVGLFITMPFILSKLNSPENYITTFGTVFTLSGVINYASSKIACNCIKDYAKTSADGQLGIFCSCLSNLEVKTNVELLKESQVIQKNYKLVFSDNKPKILKNKYIKVPLSNGYEETILQEHILGTKDYEVSVQEPTKKLRYKKLARTTS